MARSGQIIGAFGFASSAGMGNGALIIACGTAWIELKRRIIIGNRQIQIPHLHMNKAPAVQLIRRVFRPLNRLCAILQRAFQISL